jgi:cytochrome oxidase Cu insertion factor (SCO1/SenC/PrrC family)
MQQAGRAWALGGLLATGLFLAGFLSAGSAGGAGPAVGEEAPDFSLTLFSGEAFTLSELKGKPVFLNFFASW